MLTYEQRETIRNIVAANPGINKQRLAREMGVSLGQVRYAVDSAHTDKKRAVATEEFRELIRKHSAPVTPAVPVVQTAAPVAPPPQLSPLPPAGIRIAAIGDMQVKPGIDLGYCNRIGRYAAYKRPDVVLVGGDFADMPSMSFHDEPGSKSYAAQNYKDDILSVHQGMKAFMEPIQAEMQFGWKPRLVMLYGNHEDRINRTIAAIPKLDGTIGLQDLEYERWGFETVPFLQPITIAGVTFCHYFPSGVMGRPITTARALLTKLHESSVAFHQQGRDIAFGKRANGKQITCIISGSSYEHDESYLNYQTNNHWRGFYMLNDVVDGEFEEMAISMKYLRRRYS